MFWEEKKNLKIVIDPKLVGPSLQRRPVLLIQPGIVMSMHLISVDGYSKDSQCSLKIICGYEDGSVAVYTRMDDGKAKTIEGLGWEQNWRLRNHKESGMNS